MNWKRKFSLLSFVVLPAIMNTAAAVPLNAPGVVVTGSGKQVFKKCSTCDPDIVSDGDTKGGDSVGSATTTGAFLNSFSWLASGTLSGLNALPVLKARAGAENPSIADPTLGIGSVSSVATAQAIQRYHYSGTEPGTYTITFNVNGVLDGDDESIDAGIAALSTELILTGEGVLQNKGLASARLTKVARSTNGAFADSASMTFDIGANEDFFIRAFLIADALFLDSLSVTGVANAADTMTASFTAGDVSRLAPVVVPVPAAYGMLLLGLGILGRSGWRRVS
jgi:hypothetical protein